MEQLLLSGHARRIMERIQRLGERRKLPPVVVRHMAELDQYMPLGRGEGYILSVAGAQALRRLEEVARSIQI